MSIFIGYKDEYLPIKGGDLLGNLDMNNHKITNVPTPKEDKDAVNKKYVDSNSFSSNMGQDLKMNNYRILNVPSPKLPTQPATKDYVDSNFFVKDSAGRLNMVNKSIRLLKDPVSRQDAATKKYVDDGDNGKLSIHGTNSMNAKLNMDNNRIGNVADPGNPEDAANKKYVDDKVGDYLKRDGSNSMNQHLNMNNKRIFNLLDPGQRDHAVTKGHLDDYVQLELFPKRLGVEGSWSNDATSYHQLWIQHPVSKKAGWWVGNQRQNARSNDNDLYFTVSYSTGTKKTVAYISDGKSLAEMNFTGQHRCKCLSPFSEGKIVSSTGKYLNMLTGEKDQKHITINDALPIVEICDMANDKKVFGVLSGLEDKRIFSSGSFHTRVEKISGDDRVFVNSVGEGGIWVCNAGGNFSNGDWICSFRQGYGQKQKGKSFLNSTVAKITMDCDFKNSTEEIEVDGIKYKTSFVGCTYHCG